MMRKVMVLMMACCLLFAGCANAQKEQESAVSDETMEEVEESTESVEEVTNDEAADAELSEEGKTIYPLSDTTMDNLNDAILSVSLEKGDVFVDDSGVTQMKVKVYTYDMYDMVDIAGLEVGDTLVRLSEEVEVTSKEQGESGTVYINGGLDEGGFDLVTEEDGIFYELGYSNAKNWYEVGEATFPVSDDFTGTDTADLDQGEVVFSVDSFLNDEITYFDFTPHNTTIRVEGGKVVDMNRRYIP